ncbi:MAG: DNA polymerase I [Patescibacteria group bacterium]|nr:DNA polymerase I [Patescibacteria group bacterium]
MKKKKRFILIDSNSLIHRAYHAYPAHLSTSKGEQINAVYGFTFLLIKVVEDLKPDYLVCAFDSLAPTKRHKVYKDYKAHRKPMEEELVAQLPKVKEVVEAFDIPVFKKDGYEADDLIGTIENDAQIKNMEKIIVSGDQDMFQLADDDTKIYLSGKSFSQSKLYGPDEVREKTGMKPNQIIELKALYGDPSDNIPGVKGIGKKGAEILIEEFGSIDKIYDNLDGVEKRFLKKLQDDKETAFLSRDLARIMRDVPIGFDLGKSQWRNLDIHKIRKLFRKYEFRSLLKKAEVIVGANDQVSGAGKLAKPRLSVSLAKVQFIEKASDFNSLLQQLAKQKVVAVFANSISDNCVEMLPQNLTLSLSRGTNYTVGASLITRDGKLTSEGEMLRKIFINSSIMKVGYDIKDLIHCFRNLGISGLDNYYDIKIAAFLVQAGSGSVALKDLIFNYLGEVVEDPSQNLEMGFGGRKEAGFLLQIYSIIKVKLTERKPKSRWGLSRLFGEIEMPLVKILADMEATGVAVDSEYLSKLSFNLARKINKVEKAIYSCVGHEFNLNSPKQVSEVLFKELDLSPSRKNKGGSYSTSAAVLEGLKGTHPVIDNLLVYRELSKIKSTYTNSLLECIDKNTGRIHTSFNLAVTSTGRLSSTNPNLQNIPIATNIGKKVRRAFVAEKGWKLISFDYSQQELRLLAHLSEDPNLWKAFAEDLDIHTHTAAGLFDKPSYKITKKERSVGKTVNFAVMYGMGSRGLSESLKISYEEAETFIKKYFEQYSDVKRFYDMYIGEVEKTGYAETMFGRRRSAAGLTSGNFFARKAVYRELINFPLQGSAADMMKLAMIETARLIDKKYKQVARIILQIHDELILEVKEEETKGTFAEEVKHLMQDICKLKVPIQVNYEIGDSLEEIH